ncbi:MAG: hypothetical protein MdMp024_0725 [Bacteroidales bacterium]
MSKSKETLSTALLNKEVWGADKTIERSMSYYAKTMDIIERTHIAMGRKTTYEYSTSSTLNGKFNTNTFASTY